MELTNIFNILVERLNTFFITNLKIHEHNLVRNLVKFHITVKWL